MTRHHVGDRRSRRPPVKAGVPITDLGAGLFALAGILGRAALHRERSGEGQHVDTSLIEAGLALSVWEATEYFGGRGVPGPLGSAHRMSAPYQAFRCADGYVTVGAANQRTFEKLAGVLGHPEWLADPASPPTTARVRHREVLAAAVDAATVTATRGGGWTVFDAAGIPCGPILDYAEAFDTRRRRPGRCRSRRPSASGRASRTIGTPLKLSARRSTRAAGRRGSASTPTRCCAARLLRRRDHALRAAGTLG